MGVQMEVLNLKKLLTGRSFKSEFKKHVRVLNLEGLGWQSHLGN